MLRKPEARIIIDGLKERGFLHRSVLSEIEEDITNYLDDEIEGRELHFATT